MNTAPENPTPENPAITILPPIDSDHRGNGKIARLPKILREQVNRMLDDGVPYKAIIEKLEQSTDPPLPYKLLEINISRWKDNGYQKYLRHEEWRDQLRILRENGSDMSELTDGPKFQETLVQIALTEIFRVLQQGELKPDSLNYIRLFNALARLNREALGLRKYNDQLATEQAALKQLDPNRKISENEQLAIVDTIDQILEMPRPRPLWSAPTERSGDGALFDSSKTTDLKASSPDPITPTPTRTPTPTSYSENCPSSPSTPNSPLPSRPCRGENPDPARPAEPSREEGSGEVVPFHPSRVTHHDSMSHSSPASHSSHHPTPDTRPSEHCLECHATLPPVPPDARRRPDDHCPSCGMRLPDIGLCSKPGFDHCLNCGATQPHLLLDGNRPRPNCHKCGERLHNPELS